MAKFKFYITDLFEGIILGTNDDDKANQISVSDDHFVVDAETGEKIINGERFPISEF